MQNILGPTIKAIHEYEMIQDGDKIAVGVSGGKDSLALLKTLANYRMFSKEKFELVAITIDLTNGETNFDPIKLFCQKLKVEYVVVKTNVFEVVFDDRKEKNPCSLCAKMRRGSLNNAAKNLGCNKVALAHHRDDLIE
ncbi:MAG: ATP-binding protein, partial [Clostridia bacterium]